MELELQHRKNRLGEKLTPFTAAFSLVEMVIVLAIVGLLMMFAAPSLLTIGSTSLKGAGQIFEGYLEQAQREARAQNTKFRMMIVRSWRGNEEAVDRQYAIWKWNSSEGEYLPSGSFGGWKSLPDGIVFERGLPEYIEFADYAESDPSTVHAREFSKSIVKVDRDLVVVDAIDFVPGGSVRSAGLGSEPKIAIVLVEGQVIDGRIVRTGRKGNRSFLLDQEPEYEMEGGRASASNASGAPASSELAPANWVHININTFTGNTRLWQPNRK